MAEVKLHAITGTATDGFHERMKEHQLNGVRLLDRNPEDAVYTITSHIQALALALEGAHQKTESGTCSVHDLNPEIIAGALGAIAYLASLANFMNSEADLQRQTGSLAR